MGCFPTIAVLQREQAWGHAVHNRAAQDLLLADVKSKARPTIPSQKADSKCARFEKG